MSLFVNLIVVSVLWRLLCAVVTDVASYVLWLVVIISLRLLMFTAVCCCCVLFDAVVVHLVCCLLNCRWWCLLSMRVGVACSMCVVGCWLVAAGCSCLMFIGYCFVLLLVVIAYGCS